jgi:hypothetical protein
LRVARGDLSAMLNAGGRSSAMARGRNRVFGALVIAEIALAVVLVIGAGLLVRSYSLLASTDPGFDPRRMLTLVLNVTGRTDIQNLRFDPALRRGVYDGSGLLGVTQFYEELVRRIDALPGVAAAGVTSAAPLITSLTSAKFRPTTSRRSVFAHSPAGCSSRPTDAVGQVSSSSMKRMRAPISTAIPSAGVSRCREERVRAVLHSTSSVSRHSTTPRSSA